MIAEPVRWKETAAIMGAMAEVNRLAMEMMTEAERHIAAGNISNLVNVAAAVAADSLPAILDAAEHTLRSAKLLFAIHESLTRIRARMSALN